MKTLFTLITAAVLTGLAIAPAVAQRPASPLLRGRIVEVTPGGRDVRIALYFQATPDAKGEVPAEIARQIVQLKAMALQLQQQGQPERANRLLQHIPRLASWREAGHRLTNWTGITLTGIRSAGFDRLRHGVKVRMLVESDDRGRALPPRAMLAKDIEQVADDTDATFRRLPGNRLIELVGEIVGTAPLTIKVHDATVSVDAAPRFRFIQRIPLEPASLRAGSSILADAVLGPDGTVRSLRHLIVFLDGGDFNPIGEL